MLKQVSGTVQIRHLLGRDFQLSAKTTEEPGHFGKHSTTTAEKRDEQVDRGGR